MSSQEDDLELLLGGNDRAILGEGPFWDHLKQVLYWVDIRGMKLHIFDPAKNEDEVIPVNQYIGCVVPRSGGGLILALQSGIYEINLETKELKKVADPEPDKPLNRFNDGKVDPKGRFWVGTLEIAETSEPMGSLYCLDTNGKVKKMVENVGVSNGLSWDLATKTMYFIDSILKRVDGFDYDVETGAITNRRIIVKTPNELGVPDGMTIDEEGMIWVAFWRGSCIIRYDPKDGTILKKVVLPVSKVTSCAFGGKDLDKLYITTASYEVDTQKEPLAGHLFVLNNPGVKGRKEPHYLG